MIEKSASFLCFERFLFTNREKLDTLDIKLRKVDRRTLRSVGVLKGERNEKQTYLRLYRRSNTK